MINTVKKGRRCAVPILTVMLLPLLPKHLRCHADIFAEGSEKMLIRMKPASVGHLRDIHIRGVEQRFCKMNPADGHILDAGDIIHLLMGTPHSCKAREK